MMVGKKLLLPEKKAINIMEEHFAVVIGPICCLNFLRLGTAITHLDNQVALEICFKKRKVPPEGSCPQGLYQFVRRYTKYRLNAFFIEILTISAKTLCFCQNHKGASASPKTISETVALCYDSRTTRPASWTFEKKLQKQPLVFDLVLYRHASKT